MHARWPTKGSRHRQCPLWRLLVGCEVMLDKRLANCELYAGWYRDRGAAELGGSRGGRGKRASALRLSSERRHEERGQRDDRRWRQHRGRSPRCAWGEHCGVVEWPVVAGPASGPSQMIRKAQEARKLSAIAYISILLSCAIEVQQPSTPRIHNHFCEGPWKTF